MRLNGIIARVPLKRIRSVTPFPEALPVRRRVKSRCLDARVLAIGRFVSHRRILLTYSLLSIEPLSQLYKSLFRRVA